MKVARPAQRLVVLVALLLTVAHPLAAQAPTTTPVYSVIRTDAVAVQVSQTGCTNCWFPPTGSDSYSNDIYERPFAGQTGQSIYYRQVDISGWRAGLDATWLYYRQEHVAGTLDAKYGVEINFIAGDRGDRGDLFISFDQPGIKLSTAWGQTGIEAYRDQSTGTMRVGGADPLRSDNGKSADGYETFVAIGSNVYARLVGNTVLEIAIRRSFLQSLNGNVAPTRAAFRGWAGRGNAADRSKMYVHDHRTRQEAGSGYRWLQTAAPTGVSATCPNSFDTDITSAQRSWLESGTPVNTGFANPCWSGGNFYEGDNTGSLNDLALDFTVFFANVDLSITKTATPEPVVVGQTLTYTLTVRNPATGSAAATGVTVTDDLPAGVTFQSAVSTQGTCSRAELVVRCSIGSMGVGTMTTITITVLAPTTARTILNVARVTSDQSDTNLDNNRAQVSTTVILGGKPSLELQKSVSPSVQVESGSLLSYSMAFTNTGTAAAVDVVVTDLLPVEVIFVLGSVQVSLPSGAVAVTEYSEDGGASWTYAPIPGGCGAEPALDACVNRLRWRLLSPLADQAPANAGSVSFTAQVK